MADTQEKAARHTPGPWRLVLRSNQTGPRSAVIISSGASGQKQITRYDAGYGTPFTAEIEANARLIAAAPSLLEVLKAFLDLLERGILVRDTRNDSDPAWAIKQLPLVKALKMADDAVRKAEGRE